MNTKYSDAYVKAYNRSADDMNNGGISRFNKEQEKKYGKEYYKRTGYEEDYSKLFDKVFEHYMAIEVNKILNNDKNYNAVRSLINNYGMTEWNEIAKNFDSSIQEIENKMKRDWNGVYKLF